MSQQNVSENMYDLSTTGWLHVHPTMCIRSEVCACAMKSWMSEMDLLYAENTNICQNKTKQKKKKKKKKKKK